MPKPRTYYVCDQCGAESSQYFGKCPSCNSWNSLVEQVQQPAPANPTAASVTVASKVGGKRGARAAGSKSAGPVVSLTLAQISDRDQVRLSSSYAELDRVLGGGIVSGSLILLGGDPGIGKSTLLLQVANRLAGRYRTLYVCAEESGQQVKLRWQRLAAGFGLTGSEETGEMNVVAGLEGRTLEGRDRTSPNNLVVAESASPTPTTLVEGQGKEPSTAEDGEFYLLPETDLEVILRELAALKPAVAVIDSIQALYFASLTSAPGSVSQVRECTSALMRVAKRENVTLFIVGHVTKEGAIAGPKVLEHLVDTVLYFEGDRFASHRLLRSVKNRFGATHEIGVFEMADRGLREVPNPSKLFLGDEEEMAPGTAIVVACEGTRPIVVELQALVSPTSYASPRRSTTGIGHNRLLQILAVLEKRVGIPLSKLDAYVSTSGGLSVEEPAADLGVAIAVAASFRDRIVDRQTVLIGEVGLGGQVRSVSQTELRLKEAAKLGFKRAIVPKGQSFPDLGLEIIPTSRVVDAIAFALSGPKDNR